MNTIQIRRWDESNAAAAVTFLASVLGRRESSAMRDWRYRCPAMEGAVAMVGDECVATMFAMRRVYHTPEGPQECLEPFEWHASEDWRAQAPGLRIVKHYMNDPRPFVAVAGTDVAGGLLERLKWKRLTHARRYVLPLSGRFLASRGRSALLAQAFNLVGRSIFKSALSRDSRFQLLPSSTYAKGVQGIWANQRRFALMRQPDSTSMHWLQQAPPEVGHYVILHVRFEGRLIGWVTTRIFSEGELRVGEILEIFLADEYRHFHPELLAAAGATLAAYEPDSLRITTTRADTEAALRKLRYRLDGERPVLVWWGKKAPPDGPVLIDGALGDHAFFPVSTAQDVAWLDSQ